MAVKEKSDAELVVFLESFLNIWEHRENLDHVWSDMEKFIDECYKCNVKGKTSHVVKYPLLVMVILIVLT